MLHRAFQEQVTNVFGARADSGNLVSRFWKRPRYHLVSFEDLLLSPPVAQLDPSLSPVNKMLLNSILNFPILSKKKKKNIKLVNLIKINKKLTNK